MSPYEQMNTIITTLVTVLATIVADYFLKLASASSRPYGNPNFIMGSVLYGITALGWVSLMTTESLAKISVLYSAFTIIALAAVGATLFKESISYTQGVGLLMAVASVVLMYAGEQKCC